MCLGNTNLKKSKPEGGDYMPNQLNHPHTKLRHQSGKPSCWQHAALLFLSLYLLAPGTYAQAPVKLDIPAQPLGAALESLARSAGLQLVYPPELVGQRRSAGLHGECCWRVPDWNSR